MSSSTGSESENGSLLFFCATFHLPTSKSLRRGKNYPSSLLCRFKAITVLPDVERFPMPRARPKPVFSDVEIARLSEAAADRSPDALLVCLLALDANLRVSEICALQWSDINLEQRTITVQHNVYKGEEQTPKGEIKTIALSSGVLRALEEHRKRGEPVPVNDFETRQRII